MILVGLLGCLDRLLDSPYILVAGLGEVRSLSISAEGRLLVGGSSGLTELARDGAPHHLGPTAADAITQSPHQLFVLREGRLDTGGTTVDTPGALDIAATWFEDLWILYPDHLDAYGPTGVVRSVAAGFTDARNLNLGTPGEMLLTLPTEVRAYHADGTFRVIATHLEDARTAIADGAGRIYVAHGREPTLSRVDPDGLTLVARFLEDPRDLQFGVPPNLHTDYLYIGSGAGRIDYIQVPP